MGSLGCTPPNTSASLGPPPVTERLDGLAQARTSPPGRASHVGVAAGQSTGLSTSSSTSGKSLKLGDGVNEPPATTIPASVSWFTVTPDSSIWLTSMTTLDTAELWT